MIAKFMKVGKDRWVSTNCASGSVKIRETESGFLLFAPTGMLVSSVLEDTFEAAVRYAEHIFTWTVKMESMLEG